MKKSRLRRKSKTDNAKLKDELDKVFSQYTRRRYADEDGIVGCVTCSVRKHWKDGMDAGHYIPRNHLCTRWLETNVWPQCASCNRFRGGKMDEYALFLIEKHGDTILEELNKLKHSICKMSTQDYQDKIKYYKQKLEELDEELL